MNRFDIVKDFEDNLTMIDNLIDTLSVIQSSLENTAYGTDNRWKPECQINALWIVESGLRQQSRELRNKMFPDEA